jgi:vacuolar-type H+-ATPase subunit E/Vma4
MSLEAIRKSILGEAESKAKAEQSEADAQAAAIIKDAEDRAKGILKQAEEEARHEEGRMRLEASSGLETERNSMVIEAKSKVIESILDQVRKEVARRVREEGMEKVLKSGLKQFAEVYQGSDFVIRTSKRNAAMVKGKHTIEVDNVDGFIISTPDRKIALNATVDAIVESSIDEIRKMVADEVFSGSAERKIERAANAMERKSERAIVKGKPGKGRQKLPATQRKSAKAKRTRRRR